MKKDDISPEHRAKRMVAVKLAVSKSGGSITNLADILEVQRPVVSVWMSGGRPVPLAKGIAIEQRYGIRAEHLCPEYATVIYYLRGSGDGSECKTLKPSGRRTRTK